jgi:hypothetical protein
MKHHNNPLLNSILKTHVLRYVFKEDARILRKEIYNYCRIIDNPLFRYKKHLFSYNTQEIFEQVTFTNYPEKIVSTDTIFEPTYQKYMKVREEYKSLQNYLVAIGNVVNTLADTRVFLPETVYANLLTLKLDLGKETIDISSEEVQKIFTRYPTMIDDMSIKLLKEILSNG